MERVNDDVKKLDNRGAVARAQKIARADPIAEELNGHIEKLSSLVSGLLVCQPDMTFKVSYSDLANSSVIRMN